METRPEPWINALRRSHDSLAALIEPLTVEELEAPSYASEWTIAQVLSHLGSQAEIFGLILEAALAGDELPGRETFPAIWDAWNARDAHAQATDGIAADRKTLERFESLSDEELESLTVELFGMNLDAAGLARLRLGEHALHSWDVAVALDQSAQVADYAVELLVDGIGQLAGRAGKTDGVERRVRVTTTSPERAFLLETGGDAVTLAATDLPDGEGDASGLSREGASLRMPSEALLRLVYGRLDARHTPPVEASEVELDELRAIFPGL